jgi:uncharacterized protein YbjT (DUF2867 family)
MRVLVFGASGFIGRALCGRLEADGHHVLRRSRDWNAALDGVDAVVNAAGIITEREKGDFERVHHSGPAALFAACVKAKVRRVVHISALGAPDGGTPYFRSKFAGERALKALPVEWQIVRPSLVYGTDGASAKMFRTLASLPVAALPELGDAKFQPVHIDDVCEAITRLLAPGEPAHQEVDLVGATTVSYAEMLDCYHRAMGLAAPLRVTIPALLMRSAAVVAGLLPGATLTRDNWRMLRAGSATGPDGAARVARLLGRSPRGIESFIAPGEAELLRHRALAAWRTRALQFALALVWIATAVISAFVYPVSGSLEILARVGLHGSVALAALYGASLLDFALGIATLAWPRRALWAVQAALILGYSIVITAAMPEYWAHPFGPVLKNLPILAILAVLYGEPTSWNT